MVVNVAELFTGRPTSTIQEVMGRYVITTQQLDLYYGWKRNLAVKKKV